MVRLGFLLGSILVGLAEPAPAQTLLQSIPPTNGVWDFCAAGDVNGDGLQDVALGFATGLPSLGEVRIYGAASGVLIGSITGVGVGITNQAGFGSRLETLGDVTGDGVPEILAGVPSTIDLSGNPIPGRVAILSPVGPTLVRMLTGSYPGDNFGYELAGHVDANGDGFPDPVVGAPTADPGGILNAGQVQGFDGLTGTVLVSFAGTVASQGVGFRLTGLSDMDGDGSEDFAVTVYQPGNCCTDVHVVSGASGQVLYPVTGGPTLTAWADLASVADLDFDGKKELVALGPNPFNAWVGQVKAFSFTTPILVFSPSALSILLGLGQSMDSAGDVDGDGFEDIVAGAPDAWAPPGGGFTGVGAAVVISGASGNQLFMFNGAFWGQLLGRVVHGLGDVDGDGLDDIGILVAGRVEIWNLIPPGVSIDGVACAGTGGYRPVIGITGTPAVGSSVAINLSKVSSGVVAFLLGGPPANNWGGLPLPFDLGIVGMPGCNLAVPIYGTVAAPTGGPSGIGLGRVSLSVAIPPDPALVGVSVAFQWYAPDPSPGPFPGVTTRRMIVTVQ